MKLVESLRPAAAEPPDDPSQLVLSYLSLRRCVGLVGLALAPALSRAGLKVALVDRHRHRVLERTRLAARIAAVELVMIVLLTVVLVVLLVGYFLLKINFDDLLGNTVTVRGVSTSFSENLVPARRSPL